METIEKRKMGTKSIILFSMLIFSTLALPANTVGDEFNHMLHNPENLIMLYVVSGVFLLCFMLYLVGKYFSRKEDRKNINPKTSGQRLSRPKVIRKTS